MGKLRLLLPFVALGLAIVFVMAGAVLAQDTVNDDFCTGEGADTAFCQQAGGASGETQNNSIVGPDGVLTQLARFLVALTAATSVIMIIVAGLMFIFGGHNPQSVARARNTVLYAIIGLVIAIVSQMIVVFVLNQL